MLHGAQGCFYLLLDLDWLCLIKKNGTRHFIRKRVSKVYVPFLILTLCWLLLDRFLLNKSYPIDIILLTLAGLNLKSHIVPTMWFVPYIIIWYAAFYLIFSLPNNNIFKSCALFILPVMFYMIQDLFETTSATFIHHFLFPIGVLAGLSLDTLKKSINDNTQKAVTLLIVTSFGSILLCFVYSLRPFYRFPFNFDFFIYFMFSVYSFSNIYFSILVFNSLILSALVDIKFETLRLLGLISYEVYLFERAVKKYITIGAISDNFWISGAVYFLIIVLLSITYKYVLNRLRKFLNHKTGVLLLP